MIQGVTVVHGLENAGRMAWEVGWALALGFLLSAIVQTVVPRRQVQDALGGEGPREIGLATALGAASSSCSYAAVAIGKSLFQSGASLQSALAFQFASTNLVFELGIAIWVLLGWHFTVAELVGGLILILVMWVLVRLLVSRRDEEAARAHAREAQPGHEHGSGGEGRLVAIAATFRSDVGMLWKEIGAGFLIAGFVALLPRGFFDALFLTHAWRPLRIAENALVGPLVAALSFVCSVGNVPLAAVLWSGGASFAGVLAFLYADLVVVPIVLIYRKVYGRRVALRIVAAMVVAMVVAALVVDGLFALAGIVPPRPPVASGVAQPIGWSVTTALNGVALAVTAGLLLLARRSGQAAHCAHHHHEEGHH